MKSGLVSFLWKKMGQDPGRKNVTVFEQIQNENPNLRRKMNFQKASHLYYRSLLHFPKH